MPVRFLTWIYSLFRQKQITVTGVEMFKKSLDHGEVSDISFITIATDLPCDIESIFFFSLFAMLVIMWVFFYES